MNDPVVGHRWLLLLLAVIPGVASASGYEINAQSAAALGQGGAVSATVATPDAVFYNPAGIAGVPTPSAMIGLTTLDTTFGYAPAGGRTGNTALETRGLFVPSAFAAAPLTHDLAVGLGLYSPVAMDVEWPTGFDARYDSTITQISSYTLAPTLAFRVFPEVTLGAGFSLTRVTLLNQRSLNFIDQEGLLRVGGGGWAGGINLGTQVSLLQHRLEFAVAFRSGANVTIDGRAEFQTPIEFEQSMPDQPMTTSVAVPSELVFGASGKPHRRVTLSLEGAIGFWPNRSTWLIAFPSQPALDISEPRAYVNPMTVRAGAQWAITDAWKVRAGGGLEPSAVQDSGLTPSMPEGARAYFSLGVGYTMNVGWAESGQRLSFDAAYSLVAVRTQTSAAPALPAAYDGHTHVIGISISGQLGPGS